jgi:putative nucleotidyltransferase-like protein
MTDTILDFAPASSRAEWRFLTQCVAMQCVGGDGVAPDALDVTGLNWAMILRLAEAHCVVPLLAAAVLADMVKNVGPDAVADLKGRFRDSGQRGMSFVIELRSLLACLKSAGIRCIPLKGPVLMLGSYRKIGLRHFDDLDLLVAPTDVPGAVAALAKLGYTGWDIHEHWIASHINTESEHQLACKERGFIVDVHWALGRKYFTVPMGFDELWRRTGRTKLIGSPVPDLSPEDAIIYLCYHGGRHLFGRLSWLCDVAATVAAHPELDWETLMAQATRMGARRLTLLGLLLAREMLQCALPDSVNRSIEDEPALGTLAGTIARGMFREEKPTSSLRQQIEASLFHLRVRERTSDRLRYLFWAVAPNARDWGDTRLPRSLRFLFMFSRPIRLVRKHLAWAR